MRLLWLRVGAVVGAAILSGTRRIWVGGLVVVLGHILPDFYINTFTTQSRPSTMPTKKYRFYSPIQPPSISMSELVCKTLDHDATDVLIDKWLEHRNDAYWDWFMHVRERRHSALHGLKRGEQLLAWSKGDFVPENIFMRTVDTARLIPLDRTWTTHVYHHRSMQDRKLSMMPVVFTMVCIVSYMRLLGTDT